MDNASFPPTLYMVSGDNGGGILKEQPQGLTGMKFDLLDSDRGIYGEVDIQRFKDKECNYGHAMLMFALFNSEAGWLMHGVRVWATRIPSTMTDQEWYSNAMQTYVATVFNKPSEVSKDG